MISVNHDKVQGSWPIVKSLYPLLFLYFEISSSKKLEYDINNTENQTNQKIHKLLIKY